MNEIKVSGCGRVKLMREIMEKQIFQHLPTYTNHVLTEADYAMHQKPKYSLPALNYSPDNKKMPPMLRYMSQKCLKQQGQKRQEEVYLYKGQKKFTMSIHHLKLLSPLLKCPSLPKIRQSQQRLTTTDETTPQQPNTVKMKFNRKNLSFKSNKVIQNRYRANNIHTILNNDIISGWKTEEHNQGDALY